jgi:serpin B
MGMPSAFSRLDADFFGMIEREPDLLIWIADVLHKAFIDVDERRTEAAAASVVIVEIEKEAVVGPTKPPPIVMKIDRPFIFFIRDIETDAILFVGRMMDPAGE